MQDEKPERFTAIFFAGLVIVALQISILVFLALYLWGHVQILRRLDAIEAAQICENRNGQG